MFGFPPALKALSVTALLLVTAGLALAPTAAAAPASASLPATLFSSSWAYGAHENASGTWTNSTGTYSITTFFGWDVLLTETNATHGFALTASRAMALDFTIHYCRSPCGPSSPSAQVDYRAWESEVGSANFTTAGAVTVNGSEVPGLAISSASDVVRASVTENWSAALHGLLLDRTESGSLSVAAEAGLNVSFSPALGLLPEPVAPGEVWNASSAFTGNGSWTAVASYSKLPWNQTLEHGAESLNGSVAGSGTVGVTGVDTGPVVLADGSVTQGLALSVSGPFALREGFLLLPIASDAFGGGDAAWSDYSNGSVDASTASLDVAPNAPHLGLLASATAYAPLPAPASSLGAAALVTPVATTSQGSGVVQAQPESVAASQAGMSCLTAGNCTVPTGPGGALGRSPLLPGLVVAGALLFVVVLAIAVVAERRRLPPPRHPNALLYPPGAAGVVAQGSAPPTSGTESPPAEPAPDPLDHLW